MSRINDILITAAENLMYGWPDMTIEDAMDYIMNKSEKPLKYWKNYKPFDTVDPRVLKIYKMTGVPIKEYLTGISKSLYDSKIIDVIIKNGNNPGELIIYLILNDDIFYNDGTFFKKER